MARRYLPVCLALIVGALVVATAANRLQSARYAATCQIRVAVPRLNVVVGIYTDLNQNLADTTVSEAVRGPAISQVAQADGVDPSTLSANTSVLPSQRSFYYAVTVTDSDATRVVRLANDVCSALVSSIDQTRNNERNREVAQVRDQLVSLITARDQLAATPSRTPDQQAQFDAYRSAVDRAQTTLNTAVQLPPDIVEVVREASGASTQVGRSLSRDLLVALVAGVLAAFIVVVVGEAAGAAPRPARPS